MDNATISVVILALICGVCIGLIGTVLTTVVYKNDKEENDGKI